MNRTAILATFLLLSATTISVSAEKPIPQRIRDLIKPFMEKYCQEQSDPNCRFFSAIYVNSMYHFLKPEFQYKTQDISYQMSRLLRPLINDLQTSTKGTECEVCKLMVSQIQEYLENPAVQEEFLDILDSMCLYLPHPVDEQCTAFVDNTVPRLIHTFVELPPQTLCSLIALC